LQRLCQEEKSKIYKLKANSDDGIFNGFFLFFIFLLFYLFLFFLLKRELTWKLKKWLRNFVSKETKLFGCMHH